MDLSWRLPIVRQSRMDLTGPEQEKIYEKRIPYVSINEHSVGNDSPTFHESLGWSVGAGDPSVDARA